MNTPQFSQIAAMLEPVYAVATHVYNASIAGRLVARSAIEGMVKQGLPQTAPGLHETVQSVLARPRATIETVNAQMGNTGTANIP